MKDLCFHASVSYDGRVFNHQYKFTSYWSADRKDHDFVTSGASVLYKCLPYGQTNLLAKVPRTINR